MHQLGRNFKLFRKMINSVHANKIQGFPLYKVKFATDRICFVIQRIKSRIQCLFLLSPKMDDIFIICDRSFHYIAFSNN